MSLARVRISGRRTALAVALTLLLAMLFSNIVHAAEQICPPSTAASAGEAGDNDPADRDHAGDSGVIHQHGGCHGHHLASPAPRASAGFLVHGRSPEVPAGEMHLSQSPPDHLLRPPIA